MLKKLSDLSLRVKGIVAVATPIVALLAVMLAFFDFEGQSRRARDRVEHTYSVRNQIREIQASLATLEVGDPGDVHHVAARRALEPALAALRDLTRDNPHQTVRIDQMRRDLEDPDTPVRVLQEVPAAMEAEEDRLLRLRTESAEQSQARLEGGVFLIGTLGLIGGIALALLFTTHIARRTRRLETQARRVARGLAIEASGGGDEIARLEQALVDTSRLLAARAEQVRAVNADLERRVAERTSALEAATEEARHANAIRSAVVQSSPLAIWTVDLEGRVISWNPAAERIFHYSEAEVLGQPLPVVAEDQWDEFRQWLEAHRDGASLQAVERTRRRKDGSPLEVRIWTAPLRDASGSVTGLVAIDSDITEQRALEEQFRQSQKLEAVGRLAGGVAHDFNNLLTVIIGYTGMLLSEVPSGSTSASYANEIQHAASRASALTAQLLAFSRRQITQPRVLDLNEVVNKSLKLLGRVIGEDIVIESHLDSELPRVRIDPIHIDQVLMNLMVNARDAMSAGGRLTIETAAARLDEHYAGRHLGVTPGSYVMLAISDTGTGMDAATKARIFEPFFTTKDSSKGTGLGLSIVHGIIKQAGGEILVYSELGHGTCFKIYLPAMDAPADLNYAEHGPLSARGGETVLVCEDETNIRKLIRTILDRHGYQVLEASTPAAALEVAAAHQGDIHLLLTDIVLPEKSGFDLAENLKAIRPDAKVLFMSGYTDRRLGGSWVLKPDTQFLQKPFTAATLTRKIREVLGHEVGVGEA
jgi:PAS domain S-box-containing protein